MTNKGTHSRPMDKEVQHSKAQAEALALRGVGERTLHRSADRLSDAQAVLFARMRDDGAKICVIGLPGLAADNPASTAAFQGARLARGRSIGRSPDFQKMPHVARTTALRSIAGGHVEWASSHPDNSHHFYGLSESGLSLLARHQVAKRRSSLPTKRIE